VARVKDVARFHTIRVVIVFFGARLRQSQHLRCPRFSRALLRIAASAECRGEVAAKAIDVCWAGLRMVKAAAGSGTLPVFGPGSR